MLTFALLIRSVGRLAGAGRSVVCLAGSGGGGGGGCCLVWGSLPLSLS